MLVSADWILDAYRLAVGPLGFAPSTALRAGYRGTAEAAIAT